MYFFEKALEYIFVPTCGVCGKTGEGYLCEKCGKKLKKYMINDNSKFEIDGQMEQIEKMHIFQYKEDVRKLILQYKFNDKSYLYKTFCEIIVKDKKAFDFIKSYDIIIPVPIHKKRMRERGYNQSELITKELAKRLELKNCSDILIKIKNNKAQSTLDKKAREENTKNVYKVINIEKINNKNVLIFDDVFTTGSTVKACITEIEKASPRRIGVLTLAKD